MRLRRSSLNWDVGLVVCGLALIAAVSLWTSILLATPGSSGIGRLVFRASGGYGALQPLRAAGALLGLGLVLVLRLEGWLRYLPLFVVVAATLAGQLLIARPVAWISLIPSYFPAATIAAALLTLSVFKSSCSIDRRTPSRMPIGAAIPLFAVCAIAAAVFAHWSWMLARAHRAQTVSDLGTLIAQIAPSAVECHSTLQLPLRTDPTPAMVDYLGPIEAIGVRGFVIPSREPKVAAIIIMPVPYARDDGVVLQLQACSKSASIMGELLPITGGSDAFLLLTRSTREFTPLTEDMLRRAVLRLEDFCSSTEWKPTGSKTLPTFLRVSLDDISKPTQELMSP